ncbi:MAG: hypothetical protein BWY12_01541 [candidate division BRC1 bacterium ADurb.Bin183]|jgi:hypothetical protein|nr:MAG: hypothetical protein BWY12_01541 [candidate division BRC1 bacterium ADurb.Bin183]
MAMSDLIDIEKKIDSLAEKLDQDISKKKKTMTITVIGGIVLLIIVFIYFGFIKGLINEVLEPQSIMMVAGDKIEKMLPELSKSIEGELRAMAPEVARNSCEQLLKAIPDGRVYLQSELTKKTDEAMDHFIVEFDSVITKTLEENKTEIVGFMRDVSDPEKKQKLGEEIYQALEVQFSQPDVKADLDSYTNVLIRMNQKIKHLYEVKELTEEEHIILDIIYCVRELAQRGAQTPVDLKIKPTQK